MATFKYVLDFQKILNPDETELEIKCQKFHQYYEYCRCPLLRNSLYPYVSIKSMILFILYICKFNYKYEYIYIIVYF